MLVVACRKLHRRAFGACGVEDRTGQFLFAVELFHRVPALVQFEHLFELKRPCIVGALHHNAVELDLKSPLQVGVYQRGVGVGIDVLERHPALSGALIPFQHLRYQREKVLLCGKYPDFHRGRQFLQNLYRFGGKIVQPVPGHVQTQAKQAGQPGGTDIHTDQQDSAHCKQQADARPGTCFFLHKLHSSLSPMPVCALRRPA